MTHSPDNQDICTEIHRVGRGGDDLDRPARISARMPRIAPMKILLHHFCQEIHAQLLRVAATINSETATLHSLEISRLQTSFANIGSAANAITMTVPRLDRPAAITSAYIDLAAPRKIMANR